MFILLLTFSNAETDPNRGQDQTEDRDEDGEAGTEAQAGQQAAQAAGAAVQAGRRCPLGIQRGEVVEAGGGAGVVVRRHLEVIGRGRAEAPHTVQVLQLQVVRHCNTQTQNLIRMSKER